MLAFAEAVSATTRDTAFDYDTWMISFFSQPVVLGNFDVKWKVPHRVKMYWNSFRDCVANLQSLKEKIGEDTFLEESSDTKCPPTSGAIACLESGETVSFVDRSGCNTHGSNGIVCPSIDGRLYLKSFSKKKRYSDNLACQEGSILEAMSITDPIISNSDGNLADACRGVSVVTESMGSHQLGDLLYRLPHESVYLVLSRFLELIRSLHEEGFAHNDLHLNNIIVKERGDIVGSMKMIDFEAAEPICEIDGTPMTIETPFYDDVMRVAEHLKELDHDFYREYYFEMDALGLKDRPRYEYWIEIFRQKATSLTSVGI